MTWYRVPWWILPNGFFCLEFWVRYLEKLEAHDGAIKENETLGEFLMSHKYSQKFRECYLVNNHRSYSLMNNWSFLMGCIQDPHVVSMCLMLSLVSVTPDKILDFGTSAGWFASHSWVIYMSPNFSAIFSFIIDWWLLAFHTDTCVCLNLVMLIRCCTWFLSCFNTHLLQKSSPASGKICSLYFDLVYYTEFISSTTH